MARMARRAAPCAGAVWLALAALAAPAAALDLLGTWHVLVHYKDSASEHPDQARWDDRIWVFEMDGARLRWTEYPIVVFRDESGRFEALGGNRASRVQHHWEPNEKQLAQIRNGLEINTRGSRSKSLRGGPRDGWRTAAAASAFGGNVLTYSEDWSIEDPAGSPLFRMVDSLGGPAADGLEGVTEYRTREQDEGGDVLRGSFSRDGTRTGSFRLTRSGAVSQTKGSGKTQAERFNEMFFGSLGGNGELAAALAAGGEDRAAVREQVLKSLEQSIRANGADPSQFRAELEDMADQILRELEAGKSPEEVQKLVENGTIAPGSMRKNR
jgi:hypothetical protein